MESENKNSTTLHRRSLLHRGLQLITAVSGASVGERVIAGQQRAVLPAGPAGALFPGFEPIRIDVDGVSINGVKGGHGPPLLLLHGYPQTHAEWHRVAPALAKRFTVVATDLRGYGDSSKVADGINHEGHSKRSMARDQVALMTHLGFSRFAVVGHDRGGRVAHRMALDHPDAVTRLAVIDIVPTLKLYSTVTKEFASVYYHWFFLIQDEPLPETLISNSAEFYLRYTLGGAVPGFISEETFAEYLRCYKAPGTIHAMCEDYRAGATIDLEHDKSDLGTRIQCPLLVLWAAQGAMDPLFNVLETWRERAVDVRGKSLPGGHWLPEQVPDQVAAELLAFLA